jgi:hypothetical protein
MNAQVVIKEGNELLPDQIKLLEQVFVWYTVVQVPKYPMALDEMHKVVLELENKDEPVIFLDPVPVMMSLLSSSELGFSVFHNEHGECETNEDGVTNYVTAKLGWELI